MITSTGRGWKQTCAAEAIPANLWRTIGQRVFGGKEQDFAAASNREPPQAGCAGGDTHGDIQSQEAFAAFGFTAKDPDRLIGPKILHQPLSLGTDRGELAGPLNGKRVHDFLAGLGSSAKTSK